MIKRKYFIIVLIFTIAIGSVGIYDSTQYRKTIKKLEITNSQLQVVQGELMDDLAIANENLQTEIEKNDGLSKAIGNMKQELDTINLTLDEFKKTEYELVYLGDFMLTSYCPCEQCCDQYALNRPLDENGEPIVHTASGTVAKAGRTIGVDPAVIPYGTKVYIQNLGWYIAEDTGGGIKEKHIDIYADTHELALSLKVRNSPVWVVVEKS